MDIGISDYKFLANKEVFWLPMDTEELYQTNLKKQSKRQLLEKYNWIDKIISYKFNSEGFRCDNFSDDPSVMFLGPSIVTGIGLPLENIWPSLVADNLKLKNYNLGIGGSSNDTAFRLAYFWIEKIKPKIVVYCRPFEHRYEILNPKKFAIERDKEIGEFQTEWTVSKTFGFLNLTKNTLAITKLCEIHNVKLVIIDADAIPKVDLARDLKHPGIESNKKYAETILEML